MPAASPDRLFLTALGVIAVTLAAHLFAAPEAGSGSAEVGGEVRDVDPQLIRQRIREGQLSDHEAEHYRILDGGAEPTPVPVNSN